MLRLIYPTANHKAMWLELMEEWNSTGEVIVPYALSFRQNSFEVFLTRTEESRLNINRDGHVPATTFSQLKSKRVYRKTKIMLGIECPNIGHSFLW
jgi:predicted acetyltransferase